MSQQRLKRLQRLEARKPRGKPWTDDSPWLIPVFQAMFEGRPFEWIPSREPPAPLTEEQEDARRRVLAESDRVAARLEQDDPGCTAAFQADVERRRRAVLSSLEREAKAREAA
jgi:hypothetical protein